MTDRHLYRCPVCGSVTRATPRRDGHMRCALCGRTFVAARCVLRPTEPVPIGEREGRVLVRERRDAQHERAARSYQSVKRYFKNFRDNIERSLGRSPLGEMEHEQQHRLERLARALVRGAGASGER